MYRYHYGLVFCFERIVKRCDPTSFLANIDISCLLHEIVLFFTQQARDDEEALEVLHETDMLLASMEYESVIPEYLYLDDASYAKLTGIVFLIAEEVLGILLDVGYFKRTAPVKFPAIDITTLSRGSYMVGLRSTKTEGLSQNDLSDICF